MCSDVVISVENLTKKFRIFGHPGDRIKQALTFGRIPFHREFAALKDISFEIKKGETVGIIGRNGSGKSTLLQLICGILKPTMGSVRVKGRISALLELGAGFNPEFTGRENVYFQGAILGLCKEEMDKRFDAIAAFADIGNFIDQPVRIYSSGMYLRLAFAVAVNVDPEILVVDEALAVGDAGFRSRCFRRIGELREAGCTILFVSHAMEQIVKFCGQAILLDEGELILLDLPASVARQYQRLEGSEPRARSALRKNLSDIHRFKKDEGADFSASTVGLNDDAVVESYDVDLYPENKIAYEPNGALIESVEILTLSGKRVNKLLSGRAYRCAYRVRFSCDAFNVRCAMLIKTAANMDLGGALSAPTLSDGIPMIFQNSTATVDFEFKCLLNPGAYYLSVAVFGSVAGVEYALHGIAGAEIFQVVADAKHFALAHVDFNCRAAVRLAGPEDEA